MGCLFGYCGAPAPGLLVAMADRLKHRCPQGWQQLELKRSDGSYFAVGHGQAAWQQHNQITQQNNSALAYAGVLFNGLSPANVLNKLSALPLQQIAQLDGAYTLALGVDDACYLARDHAGIKTLYWTVHQQRLLFASELKALFAESSLPRVLRPAALLEYLSFSFVPGANTMLSGIQELQPGTLLRYQQGRVQLTRHFRFEEQEYSVTEQTEQQHTKQFWQALQQSVADCLAVSSDRPGVFISGGIDSSAVLALASQQSGQRLPTFSIHFGAQYPNENVFIEQLIARYPTEHHWLEVKPALFVQELPDIIGYLDEPIGDPVTVPNFLLAREAAKHTSVILNGEGGDPCLGGPKNIPMLLARLYGPAAGETSINWLERQYLQLFQRCYDDLSRLLDPEVVKAAGGLDALIDTLAPYFNAAAPHHFLNKLMSTNIRLKGANLILVKVDKMTSANGLLALPPLFTRRIIEASMACPPQLKLNGSVEKYILKQALRGQLPETIIQRPKSGMLVPVSFWLRDELHAYTKRVLNTRQLKQTGLLRPNYIKQLLAFDAASVPGQRHGLKLWMLLTLMLWYEQTFEAGSY